MEESSGDESLESSSEEGSPSLIPFLENMILVADWPTMLQLCNVSRTARDFCLKESNMRRMKQLREAHLQELAQYGVREWEEYCKKWPTPCARVPEIDYFQRRARMLEK